MSRQDQKDDLQSRLENLEDVTLEDEQSEIADLIESGELEDAEDLLDELESERG